MIGISLLHCLLETFGYGAVVTSPAGAIQAKNQAAERILRKMLRMPPTAPLPVRLPRGFLAMLDASAPSPLSMTLPGTRPCVAQKFSIDGSSVAFLLVCVDLNVCGPVQTELLQSVFGLTPCEAQLARGLSIGDSLSAIAARSGVGIGTSRGQLKSIFLKTDTNRQAELVVILGQLACFRAEFSPPSKS
jgi:DNA-binding CsgD family transcriptional regulator